jgi:hypothetical protein
VIGAMCATLVLDGGARAEESSAETMYFVPGGRIGFKQPPAIKPLNNTWHLLSVDQTLQVQVSEAPRIDAYWDARFWDPDRAVLVTSGSHAPGMDYRRFRDTRYEGSIDYSAEIYALRDNRWIGKVQVSTSTLGSRLSVPGGQIARWRPVIDALLASITVRPTPTVPQALSESRVGLTVDSFNPRFVGDDLILSLAPPKTVEDMLGIGVSNILVSQLSLRPVSADQIDTVFDLHRLLPGSRVIMSPSCRGVVQAETKLGDTDPTHTTNLMAFGRTRLLKFQAFYSDADRVAILQALEQVFSSLSLPDIQ